MLSYSTNRKSKTLELPMIMRNVRDLTLSVVCAGALATSSAHAGLVIDTYLGYNVSDIVIDNYTVQAGSDMSLVFGASNQWGNPVTSLPGITIDGVFYDWTYLGGMDDTSGLGNIDVGIFFYGIDLGTVDTDQSISVTGDYLSNSRQTGLYLAQLSGFDLNSASVVATPNNDGGPAQAVANSGAGTAGDFVLSIGNAHRFGSTTLSGTVASPQHSFTGSNIVGQAGHVILAADGTITATADYTGDRGGGVGTLVIAPVPEPGTYAMIAGALALGFVMLRRRMS